MSAVILTLLFFLSGCTGGPKFNSAKYNVVDLRNDAPDLMVPQSMMKQLENLTAGTDATPSVDALTEGDVGMVAPNVEMVESTGGILHGANVKLELSRGGGTVDFANYVDLSEKGDFYLRFEIPGIDQAKKIKVFFWGRTAPQKIGSNLYGLKCDQYADISHYFVSHILKKGILLTTHHDLYLQSAAGTFIFAFLDDDRWQVAEITLLDSRQQSLDCPRPADVALTRWRAAQ